ncbi:MAG: hypothetical protein MI976_07120 [Pseudomonadales bacterium]|nr:hypothetical protein [Pseudomonadales bacterium]
MKSIHRVTASYLFFVVTSLMLLWSFLADSPDSLIAQEQASSQSFTQSIPPPQKEISN